eukprot:m51a1_g6525 putative dol-p-man:man c -pp-dol alpha- -mannosyltransferase (405) ;mRNA; f:9-1751
MKLRQLLAPLVDYRYFGALAALLLAGDALLNVAVINIVPYTEIDWKAYMQEVEGFLGGELNYTKMRGDTGPLVYPAGFLYVFSALHELTGSGSNVRLAQYVWAGLYVAVLAASLAVYRRARLTPPWAVVLLCASYRIHSIFALRLFNDCVAMLLCYCAVLLFTRNRWSLGCAAFSLGVSVKMNVLLFAPGLLCLLLQRFGLWGTVPKLFICGALQLLLGLPFLLTYPFEYIKMSFDLGRVFFHVWTVNWKFVPEELFVSKQWALALLALQLVLLALFAALRWRRVPAARGPSDAPGKLPSSHIVATLFVSNFVGIVCARSLHYQFYVWYFHSIPLLLWQTPYHWLFKLLLFVQIEVMWNVYPSQPWSSALLLVAHALLLAGIALRDCWAEPAASAPAPSKPKKA